MAIAWQLLAIAWQLQIMFWQLPQSLFLWQALQAMKAIGTIMVWQSLAMLAMA